MLSVPPTRILLVDDHRLFNDGLAALLNAQVDFTVCGQVFRASEVLPAIQRTRPHLLLLDVNIQGTNGLELGRAILESYPTLRILMLTMYNQLKLVEEARRTGLHGYMLKDTSTTALLTGIRTVLAGRTCFDPDLTKEASVQADQFGDDFAKKLNLTFREIEVVRLVRDGLSSEQIAAQLCISHETVKTHRKNVHFKLGISKLADLIQFANQHKL